MKKKKKISTERIISVCAVILFFAAWYLVTALELVDPKLIPTPKATWDSFVEVLTQGYKGHTLLQHLGTSMERLLKAFLLSVVTAVPLGLLSGFSSKIKAFVEPFIEFYRPLPPLAYYTLLTLALGIGNSSKIALLFLACFAPIYVACVSAVARIKEDYINAAYTVGATRMQVFWSVILPSCAAEIFVGLRTAIGVAYSTLVAAEMVAASSGIGWMVVDAGNWFRNEEAGSVERQGLIKIDDRSKKQGLKKGENIMRVKRLVSLALAGMLAASVALTGCGSKKEATTSDGKTIVKIGTQQMPNDEGIAKAMNYFQEEMGDSVSVEIVEFSSGKDVNTALAAGSIDFGLEGSCPASLAIAQDLGVELIWIHEVLGDVESLVATGTSGINTVADLKGKKVAVPFASTAHFSLLKAMENAGLSASDVTVLDMQPDKIYASWNSGDIDAAYIWEPTLSQLSNKKTVITSGELAKAGYMTSNVEVVRTKFAEAHPDIVAAYVKALDKSVSMYKNDESTAIKTIAEAMELTEDNAKFQMSGSTWLTGSEQISSTYLGTSSAKGAVVQNLYDTAEFLKTQGSITKVPDKSVFEKAVNPKYIETALGK